MDDLVRWLSVQLDEDERIARDADPGPWKSNSLGRHDQSAIKLGAPTSLIQFDGSRAAANGVHVARHDPARVLREVDAKRRTLALHSAATGHSCSTTDETGYNFNYDEVSPGDACTTLRLLASVYADRDGYRDDWRP
jgi:hypothetical protein